MSYAEAVSKGTRSTNNTRLVASLKFKFDGSALTKRKIFEIMRNIIGSVNTHPYQSTGFFLSEKGRTVFATCFHSLHPPVTPTISGYYKSEPIKLDKKHISLSEDLDLQLLDCLYDAEIVKQKTFIATTIPTIPLAPDNYEIAVGTTVYFLGLPLATIGLIFHKGYISSVEDYDDFKTFTIDGTILPGHSGAPVVVKSPDQKQLYIIGMIQAVALDSVEALKALITHNNSDIQKIGNVIKKNLSPGIGQAIDIRICRKLLS